MRSRKGFTLVEMLVVIVIIMLLAALLVMLIKGTVDRARYAKTQGLIRKLDSGCEVYRVDYNTYPIAANSTELHTRLGADPRWVIQRYGKTDSENIVVKKPPIVQFHLDELLVSGSRTNVDPNPPVPIVDVWENEIRYKFPGVKNKQKPDIWSYGKEGDDDSSLPPTDTEFDDVCNWAKDY
jgi:prepilin-type N-terminal cleavage/methylation domain-containing protein